MRPPVHPIRQRVTDRIKSVGGLVGAGLSRAMGPRAPSPLAILMYHRVAPAVPGLPFPGLNVRPENLERQLAGLQHLGIQFVDLEDSIARMESGEALPARAVSVTFDDGFAGVFRWALPILEGLGIPATVFPVTARVDDPGPMPFDVWGRAYGEGAPPVAYRSVSREELQALAASRLVRVGCHTHNHQPLVDDADRFRADCQRALQLLESWTGRVPRLFAYPFGDPNLGYANPRSMEIVQELGFRCALTTRVGRVSSGESPFGWPRLPVIDADTPRTLEAKVNGWYDWMGRAGSLFHRVLPW